MQLKFVLKIAVFLGAVVLSPWYHAAAVSGPIPPPQPR